MHSFHSVRIMVLKQPACFPNIVFFIKLNRQLLLNLIWLPNLLCGDSMRKITSRYNVLAVFFLSFFVNIQNFNYALVHNFHK